MTDRLPLAVPAFASRVSIAYWLLNLLQLQESNESENISMLLSRIVNLSILTYSGENPSNIVANVLNCDIRVNEFELQLRYNFHFWINALEKGTNHLIPPLSNGLHSITTVLLQE